MPDPKRPRVRIRFKYNQDTGEIEEFIIDDNAPAAREQYHDGVAQAIAGYLSCHPEIEDAGGIRLAETPNQIQTTQNPAENQTTPDRKQEDQLD